MTGPAAGSQPEWASWPDERLLDLRLCDLGVTIGEGDRDRIDQLYGSSVVSTGFAALLAVRRVVLPGRRARCRDPLLPRPPSSGATRAGPHARGRGRDAGVVHAAPAPRDRACHRERLPPAPAPPPAALRQVLRAIPGLLRPTTVQPPLRRAPGAVVRAEPPRRGLRRDLGSAWCPSRTGASGTRVARAQEAQYMDAVMREIADGVRRSSPGPASILSRLRKTLRQHYQEKRRHYGLDKDVSYDRELRRLSRRPRSSGTRRRRRASSDGSAARCVAGWPGGPASTSTRSIRCSGHDRPVPGARPPR